jgi:UDP-N-acetylglucosamine--N-acetylmuramyl-(pentapeptide) pyrophosphoryl-undecaprenol N-acetylglucosamine transferase
MATEVVDEVLREPARTEGAAAEKPTIHLVASAGGHLELLAAVTSATKGYARVWLTPDSDRARAIETRGERVETIPFYGRNPIRLLSNLWAVLRSLRRGRPRTVVTSGAGTVIPFCLLARALGARIIFIETMARVTNASMSGLVLSRIASTTLVQWQPMTDVYPNARLCQPALLDGVVGMPVADGHGTFVALGTHVQPFDRLLEVVDRAVQRGVLPTPVLAQSGVTQFEPESFQVEPWFDPDAVQAAMRTARYIVCHAGSGLISSALRAGRRPLVMARRRTLGEHVDDHQLQILAKLSELGMVVAIEDEITEEHLAAADAPLVEPEGDAVAGPSVEEALAYTLAASDGGPSAAQG